LKPRYYPNSYEKKKVLNNFEIRRYLEALKIYGQVTKKNLDCGHSKSWKKDEAYEFKAPDCKASSMYSAHI